MDDPNRQPTLFEFLTREEFKICWAIVFVSGAEGYEDSYDLGRYATPTLEGPTGDYYEKFKRVIRFLDLGTGFVFSSIKAMPDFDIVGAPIEPNNRLYFEAMRTGWIPDPQDAIELALRDVRVRECGINLEPLMGALADIRESVKNVIAEHGGVEAEKTAMARAELLKLGRQLIDDTIASVSKGTVH